MRTPEGDMLTALVWEDLEVGREYGPYTRVPSEGDVRTWSRIYERPAPDDQVVPPGLIPIHVLHALRSAFNGIPPGGVLQRQTFRLGVAPRVGNPLHTRVSVVEKYERRERSYVVLHFTISGDDGRLVADSRKTLIWPRRPVTKGDGHGA